MHFIVDVETSYYESNVVPQYNRNHEICRGCNNNIKANDRNIVDRVLTRIGIFFPRYTIHWEDWHRSCWDIKHKRNKR